MPEAVISADSLRLTGVAAANFDALFFHLIFVTKPENDHRFLIAGQLNHDSAGFLFGRSQCGENTFGFGFRKAGPGSCNLWQFASSLSSSTPA
jgi:hypothetical protein